MRVRFGPFEADLRSGELSRDGRKVPLQDKPFHILALLVERPGELVTRDELRQRLWPADTFVDFEHGLNTAVKKLRQGLEDSAEDPRYVETLARRGYRFIAPVTEPDAETVDPAVAAPARARRFGGRWAASVLAAVLGAAIVGIVLVRDRTGPATGAAEAPSLVVLPFANLGGSPQDDYLADGLSEVVITELAKVPGLLVISRNTAFLYRGRPADVRRMASDLHVTHVLEGSVQRADGQLRVSAQLTTVAEADITAIARLREQAKAEFEAREGIRLSFLPFFAMATCEALKVHPNVNASIDMDAGTVTYHDAVHHELDPLAAAGWGAKVALDRFPRAVFAIMRLPVTWRVIEKLMLGQVAHPGEARGAGRAAMKLIDSLGHAA